MKIKNTFVKIICQKILHEVLLTRKFTTSSKFEWASLVAQLIKNLPATQETLVQFLGWEDPLEEGMATHYSILAWRILMDRRVWRATAQAVTKSLTATKQSTAQ